MSRYGLRNTRDIELHFSVGVGRTHIGSDRADEGASERRRKIRFSPMQSFGLLPRLTGDNRFGKYAVFFERPPSISANVFDGFGSRESGKRFVLARAIASAACGNEVVFGMSTPGGLWFDVVESDVLGVCIVKIAQAVQTSETVAQVDSEPFVFSYPIFLVTGSHIITLS